tara:strand:- start:1335 stop:1757 length:423 start_codon:yes stop_codon:yes gene_type:complete
MSKKMSNSIPFWRLRGLAAYLTNSFMSSRIGDSEDRWIQLESDGSWKYEVRKGTGGKKVHFYVTVVETDHPDSAAAYWNIELDCSCNNQHKKATVGFNEKHEFSVDTNFWSDTTFDFHLTSQNGANDAGVLVRIQTNTTS